MNGPNYGGINIGNCIGGSVSGNTYGNVYYGDHKYSGGQMHSGGHKSEAPFPENYRQSDQALDETVSELAQYVRLAQGNPIIFTDTSNIVKDDVTTEALYQEICSKVKSDEGLPEHPIDPKVILLNRDPEDKKLNLVLDHFKRGGRASEVSYDGTILKPISVESDINDSQADLALEGEGSDGEDDWEVVDGENPN